MLSLEGFVFRLVGLLDSFRMIFRVCFLVRWLTAFWFSSFRLLWLLFVLVYLHWVHFGFYYVWVSLFGWLLGLDCDVCYSWVPLLCVFYLCAVIIVVLYACYYFEFVLPFAVDLGFTWCWFVVCDLGWPLMCLLVGLNLVVCGELLFWGCFDCVLCWNCRLDWLFLSY